MQEKKTSTGVVRVRLNVWTIIVLIILPFLLFILYAILFSECSDLLKKSGPRSVSPKFDNFKRNDFNKIPTENDEDYISVDIFKELGIADKDDPLALINKLQFKGDSEDAVVPTKMDGSDISEESIEEPPTVYSVIRIIILPEESDSGSQIDTYADDVRKQDDDNANKSDQEIEPSWETQISRLSGFPKQPSTKKDLSSQNFIAHEIESENSERAEAVDNKQGVSQNVLFADKPQPKSITKDTNEPSQSNNDDKSLRIDLLPTNNQNPTVYGETEEKKDDLHNMYYQFMDFDIPNTYICPNDGQNMNLLIVIQSDAENFEQRNAIRETWAKVARMDSFSYAFIVGIAPSDSIDRRLKHESDQFHDLIQTDILARHKFKDANAVMILKWVKVYCSHVKYVIKADDNVFLNVPQIARLIVDDEMKSDVMYGDVYTHELPDRNPNSENYMPKELFPGEIYPNFLNRAAYLMPAGFADKLWNEAVNMPYVSNENILITGMLAEKLNIEREDASTRFAEYKNIINELEKCSFLKYAVVYPVTPEQMRSLWDEIKSTDFKCYHFLDNMLEMVRVGKNSGDIYDQLANLHNVLNNQNLSPRVKEYPEVYLH